MEDHAHLSRYDYHRKIGLTLAQTDVGHPWGCVAMFYAAYHSARWALQRDDRFDDLAALKAINPNLMPEDRNTTKHKARRSRGNHHVPDFGVSDLVLLLYPTAASAYDKLHHASIEVRYDEGDVRKLPSATRLEKLLDGVHTTFCDAVINGGCEVPE